MAKNKNLDKNLEDKVDQDLNGQSEASEEQVEKAPEVPSEEVVEKQEEVKEEAQPEQEEIIEEPITREGVFHKLVEDGDSIANICKSYHEDMKYGSTFRGGVYGAGRNFGLYTMIMSILNQEDYETFKANFDVINHAFFTYRHESFADSMLHRFDMEWSYGEQELQTYKYLVTIISMLCDFETRSKNINDISFVKALSPEVTVFNATQIKNIREYYGVN